MPSDSTVHAFFHSYAKPPHSDAQYGARIDELRVSEAASLTAISSALQLHTSTLRTLFIAIAMNASERRATGSLGSFTSFHHLTRLGIPDSFLESNRAAT